VPSRTPQLAQQPKNGSSGGGGSASLPLPKATIINIDGGNQAIECMFNPKEYSISKKNNWGGKGAPGKNVPKQQFGGGDPETLTLQLMFDTYVGANGSKDVRAEYTSKIWKLAQIDPKLRDMGGKENGRPPRVCFQWGPTWSFTAVITSIKQKFTLFSADGTPVRATMDVTFQQVIDDKNKPKQNPTSGGTGGESRWVVKEGDTLASIAYESYGDATRWRTIADANRLTRVRDLRPGLELGIPASA
jgi:hypothetical protein